MWSSATQRNSDRSSRAAKLAELLETLRPAPLVLVAGLVLGEPGMSEREARPVGRFRFELDGDQRLGVAAFPAPGVHQTT